MFWVQHHQFSQPSVTTEESLTTIFPASLTYGDYHTQCWRYQGEFQSGRKRGGNWSKGNAHDAFREQGLACAGWRDGSGAGWEDVDTWFLPPAQPLVHTYRIAMAKIQGQRILVIFINILKNFCKLFALCNLATKPLAIGGVVPNTILPLTERWSGTRHLPLYFWLLFSQVGQQSIPEDNYMNSYL